MNVKGFTLLLSSFPLFSFYDNDTCKSKRSILRLPFFSGYIRCESHGGTVLDCKVKFFLYFWKCIVLSLFLKWSLTSIQIWVFGHRGFSVDLVLFFIFTTTLIRMSMLRRLNDFLIRFHMSAVCRWYKFS